MNQTYNFGSRISRLAAAILFASLPVADACADTVFKCKGTDGTMHYQATRCVQADELNSWQSKDFKSAPMPVFISAPVIARMSAQGGYTIEGEINGTSVAMLVDTGAAFMTVPSTLADRFDLRRGAPVRISTANGISVGYRTVIRSLKVAKFSLQNIEAVVMPNMRDVLLGQTALRHLKIEQASGELRISAL